MMTLPPSVLDMLHLGAGSSVSLKMEDNRLIVEPEQRRYTLQELLAQSEEAGERTAEEQEWLDGRSEGRELL